MLLSISHTRANADGGDPLGNRTDPVLSLWSLCPCFFPSESVEELQEEQVYRNTIRIPVLFWELFSWCFPRVECQGHLFRIEMAASSLNCSMAPLLWVGFSLRLWLQGQTSLPCGFLVSASQSIEYPILASFLHISGPLIVSLPISYYRFTLSLTTPPPTQ